MKKREKRKQGKEKQYQRLVAAEKMCAHGTPKD